MISPASAIRAKDTNGERRSPMRASLYGIPREPILHPSIQVGWRARKYAQVQIERRIIARRERKLKTALIGKGWGRDWTEDGEGEGG